MKKILTLAALLMIPSMASAATLSVSPSSQNVKVGDVFTVTVRLDTQGTAVDGVDLRYLNFNPAIIQVQDANSASAGTQITAGSLMPATLLNKADNSLGRVSFSQVTAGGTKYTGAGTLATISFKAVAAGTAQLTFNYTPSNTTDSNVAAAGSDVLNAVINGSYTVQSSSALPPPTLPTNPAKTNTNPVRTNINTNAVPPTTQSNTQQNDTDRTQDSSVPLPPDDNSSEIVEARPSSGSIWDVLKYIINRIRIGIERVFGL